MNLSQIFSAITITDTNSPTFSQVIAAMLFAFLLSFPVALTYRSVQKNYNYSAAFVRSLFVFSWASSILTLIIGNNLVKAIGLVGAISVVRFRNALKSPYDAVYIFWALGIGVSCGSGYYMVAALLVLFGCCFEFILHYLQFGKAKTKESIIKVTFDKKRMDGSLAKVEELIKGSAKNSRKINTIVGDNQQQKILVYLLKTPQKENIESITSFIEQIEGVVAVSSIENNNPPLMI